jgi:putative membrane protein
VASRFLDDAGKRALADAIASIEAASSVEVVVAVRLESGHYRHADLLAGALAAVATLAFLLYAPWSFSYEAFLVDPVLVGLLAGWVVARTPRARRALSSRKLRARQVTTGAHAAFHEKEVGLTRRRTGMLVYVSLLERELRVLPDRAIVEAVPAEAWRARVDAMSSVIERGGGVGALAAELTALAPLLGEGLPRAADDVNELPDAVDAP